MKAFVATVLIVIALVIAGDAAAQTVPSWCTGPQCDRRQFDLKNCKDLRQIAVENNSGVGWKDQNIRQCFFRIRACTAIWIETRVPYDSMCPEHSNVAMARVCCDALNVSFGDCYSGTQQGFTYLVPISGTPTIHQDPTSDSPVVGSPPNGERVLFTQVQQRDGQSWYFVHPPGGTPGWAPGSDTACTRPPATYVHHKVRIISDPLAGGTISGGGGGARG